MSTTGYTVPIQDTKKLQTLKQTIGPNEVHSLAISLIDETGEAYGIEQDGNHPHVISHPHAEAIVTEGLSGHTFFRVLGYNGDVDNAFEDMWTTGGSYVFPTTGMQMEIVGGAQDHSTGTGVRTVEIHYLDNDWAEQTETVSMSGVTTAFTVATDIYRVNGFHAVTVGSGGFAAGTINLRHLSDTPIYAQIVAGENTSLGAIWTVPADNTAYLVSWKGGVGNATGNRMARFELKSTSSLEGVFTDGVFQTKDIIITQDGSQQVTFQLPLKIPAKSDIKISVISDAANSNALTSGAFEGWYET